MEFRFCFCCSSASFSGLCASRTNSTAANLVVEFVADCFSSIRCFPRLVCESLPFLQASKTAPPTSNTVNKNQPLRLWMVKSGVFGAAHASAADIVEL